MIPHIDLRTTSSPHPPSQASFSAPVQDTAVLSASIPETPSVKVSERHSLTGVPSKIVSDSALAGDKVSQALSYVHRLSPTLGFAPEAPPQFVPDPHVQSNSSGASVVHLHQQHHGIPIFQTVRDVRFTPAGAIKEVTGDSAVIPPSFTVMPFLGATGAFRSLLKFVVKACSTENGQRTDVFGEPLGTPDTKAYSSYEPKVIARFPVPSRPTVFEQGPFEAAPTAQLVIFNQYPQLRLGWQFAISLSCNQGDYDIVVAADEEGSGEILYSLETTNYLSVRGNVYLVNGASGREMVDFPRPLTDYPVQSVSNPPPEPVPTPMPNFPRPWVSSNMTVGNSTQAVLGNSTFSFTGTENGDILTFNPSDATGDDQKLVNIFYYCCYMHDFFYLLGFDEPSGNFQEINFSGLGAGSDSVTAQAHSGAVFGTANMRTPPDGVNPTMNMGLVTSTNRHTAFSADVVFHEFVHGVTNRFVGGRMNSQALSAPQSRGMGEAWSDFFALTVQNYYRKTEQTTVGAWVVGNTGGIRGFPYDEGFPDTFANLGTGRYVDRAPHNIGEIWCATLMSLNRQFVEKFGKDRGYNLMWRIVSDGLQTTGANPSFLDARDEMYNALDDLHASSRIATADYDTAKDAAKRTFAKYGMGPNASSNGAFLFDIRPDFNP